MRLESAFAKEPIKRVPLNERGELLSSTQLLAELIGFAKGYRQISRAFSPSNPLQPT